jgi:hypothetical protein
MLAIGPKVPFYALNWLDFGYSERIEEEQVHSTRIKTLQ